MAKKRKGKYPNLDKGKNLKRRADYIEPDYVNGIKGEDGEYVIRPLTEEEKSWLNDFYGETIAVSDRYLNPTEQMMEYMKKKSNIKKEIKDIKKEKSYKSKKQSDKDSKIKSLLSKIDDIEEKLDQLRLEYGVLYPTCDEHRELYNENNSRNFCLYNNRKARGMLLELTDATLDTFLAEYWDVLSSFGYDAQDAFLESVEERLRAEGFLGEEPQYLSKASSDTDDTGKDK